MDYINVHSAILSQIGYEARNEVLEIRYVDGRVVRFLSVPPSAYIAFMNSEDKDAYFSENIERQFAFRQVKPVMPKE